MMMILLHYNSLSIYIYTRTYDTIQNDIFLFRLTHMGQILIILT